MPTTWLLPTDTFLKNSQDFTLSEKPDHFKHEAHYQDFTNHPEKYNQAKSQGETFPTIRKKGRIAAVPFLICVKHFI